MLLVQHTSLLVFYNMDRYNRPFRTLVFLLVDLCWLFDTLERAAVVFGRI